MMRYAILLAMMLLCLPVRGEAWQVVGGGSAIEQPLWHWDASGTSSGTIIVEQTATALTEHGTVNYVAGYSGNGLESTTDASYVSATGGANFPYDLGRVELFYKDTLAGDLSYATIFDTAGGQYRIQRRGAYTTTMRVVAGGQTWDVDVGINVFDGSFHKVVMSWDCGTNTIKMQIDDGTVFSNTSLTLLCSSRTSMSIGADVDGSPISGGITDEVKVYANPL